MAAKRRSVGPMRPNPAMNVEQTTAETGAQALARCLLRPEGRHAVAASAFATPLIAINEKPGIGDFIDHVKAVSDRAEAGDVAVASRMLASQALTLDAMFTELARRAAANIGEHLLAADRYARLAMKAQSNCRATLEALARLHQPREQTVRHVHVNDGGQAIVADHFHHHRGAEENAVSSEQSHAAGPAGECAALPRNDAAGQAVPVPDGVRPEKVSNARRDESGGT
ncbi:hypothetical protein [Brevundimonas sp. SL161]|uniref:hypothetical protein n=1 Tax=Brevundimonas sp. SL161 TaxID=2804613 RepID=UPI003CEE7A6E